MPQGLTLNLGGAPNTWHSVVGLMGWFHPTIPVPVGEPGCVPADIAKKASRDTGCPVVLGEHKATDLQEGFEGLQEEYRANLVAARQQKDVAPVDQLSAAVDAAKEK